MKLAHVAGALLAATALTTTAAQAADLYTPDPVIEYATPGFNWDGFYAGIGVAGSWFNGGTNVYQGEIEAGVNFTSGDLLFGIEGFVGYGYATPANLWGGMFGGEARVGYLVSPEVLLYLSGGGVYTQPNTAYATLGAGIEFAATDNLSLDFEYKFLYNSNTVYGHEVGASLLWHF